MKTQKQIPGFSKYDATDDGHIIYRASGEFVEEHRHSGGYPCVTVKNDAGKSVQTCVHRLVALAFIENPEHKKYVDHIDADRTNNRASNLRWVTQSENMKNPNMKKSKGKSHNGFVVLNLKLDEETRRNLGELAKANGRAACREAEQIIKKAVNK